jgi:hypothetical protein
MKGAVVLASALATMLSFADLSAQAPDFSGSWTSTAAPAGGGGGGGGGRGGGRGGGLGMAATIAQTATTLTVTRTVGGADVQSVYNLDGSPSTNTLSFGGQSFEQTSTAAWDGSRLVVTTQGQNGNTVMALSLNAQGQLVVETTAPGRGGGEPTTTTITYSKN